MVHLTKYQVLQCASPTKASVMHILPNTSLWRIWSLLAFGVHHILNAPLWYTWSHSAPVMHLVASFLRNLSSLLFIGGKLPWGPRLDLDKKRNYSFFLFFYMPSSGFYRYRIEPLHGIIWSIVFLHDCLTVCLLDCLPTQIYAVCLLDSSPIWLCFNAIVYPLKILLAWLFKRSFISPWLLIRSTLR